MGFFILQLYEQSSWNVGRIILRNIRNVRIFFFFFFSKIEIFSKWFFCFSSLKGSLLKHKKNMRNFLILGLGSLIFELLFENYKTFFFFLLFKLELTSGQVAVESTIVQKGHLFFKGHQKFPQPQFHPFFKCFASI